MKMSKAERAELDRCTALAKRIRTAERLSERPAEIVLNASTLLTFERTMAGRQDQARPSEVREVLELRLNDPAGYKARLERTRPAAGMYGLDAVLARG
jgi:rRNA pseudouridine-1189 N-methylase Emg1 (Nep1/Mra1 family)